MSKKFFLVLGALVVLTLTQCKKEDEYIAVTSVALNQSEVSISFAEGSEKTAQLVAAVAPKNATNPKVTWKSSKPEIAKVDENGLVTALALGEAIITATSDDGKKTAVCKIIVLNKKPTPENPYELREIKIVNGKVNHDQPVPDKITLEEGKEFDIVVVDKKTGEITDLNNEFIHSFDNKEVASIEKFYSKLTIIGKKEGNTTLHLTLTTKDGTIIKREIQVEIIESKEPSKMVLTTEQTEGKLNLSIKTHEEHKAGVWIDLNNDGIRQDNESVKEFGKYVEYSFSNNKTFTIHGKITEFSCYASEVTQLDVSRNIHLITLYCHNNKLTQLDVSKNKNLKRLSCQKNQLTQLDVSQNNKLDYLECMINNIKNDKMEALLKSLPIVENSNISHRIFVFSKSNSNERNTKLSTAQINMVKEKGWDVYFQVENGDIHKQ